MNVLAFDTASPRPSVALLAGGRIFERPLSTDRRASEELLPAVQRVFSSSGLGLSDCERIAVLSGPGSFTGIRVGLATAWGLGRALGVETESVSTLEAIAEAARAPGLERVAALLDAGRDELVLEFFSLTEPRARSLSGPQRVRTTDAAARCSGWEFVALPEDLLGVRSRGLSATPARAVALAVARAPRRNTSGQPSAIYARASAAEEKLGAS
jgi:tRNA threonylcarbamoyladenosine biosynthesis protein TsaB